jgi:hypothetical protein
MNPITQFKERYDEIARACEIEIALGEGRGGREARPQLNSNGLVSEVATILYCGLHFFNFSEGYHFSSRDQRDYW